ncbi:ATP-dependent zinc metalloprotease FtsH [Desulfurispora thermophila]|uniref:ATP-dependent zinc metalloprotease FtsH n=1 Tax=Desulfurispora thermophila TaxID=265470 RepID=UPI000365CA9A|nr:ATP-dependent zinc metalloprotease FtsH [Desulfurispora thermophila]
MNRVLRNLSIYLLIVLVIVALMKYAAPETTTVEQIRYDQFLELINRGEVASVSIQAEDGVNLITGETKTGSKFELTAPQNDQVLNTLLQEKNIPRRYIKPPQPAWWTGLLTSLLPILIFVFLFFFLMQQTQGGGNRVMSFGKSRARMITDDKRRVTFADVAGADEVKEELQEIVEFLKNPHKYNELGARIPKGVLLFGPPGTGKTLLARAVAGEAGVPFFTISGSDFVEMFVGVGASRVRDLFDQAKKNAPCIVFIDEIDAVGRQRGAGLGGGHDEREQTLNQLLVEMDGFAPNEGIIIIAATNRPDILDPALLRPGRFDRQIVVDVPDLNGRKDILKVHVRGKPLAPDVDLDVLARRTPGFTGADLANLVNEAALLAARFNKKQIGMDELENSIERVIAGPEKKSKVISEKEKRLVSYHEAGHALVGYVLPNTDPVHKVSIIPRGRAGGYTLLLPKEDRYYMTRSMLLDQVTMLLGGRVAEAVVLKEISTGAQNDLERATEIVRRMVMEYGMSDELGPLTLGRKQEAVFLGRDLARDRNYGEEVASAIDREVRRIIDQNYNRAKEILERYMDVLHQIAGALMEKETLEAEEFAAIMRENGIEPHKVQ